MPNARRNLELRLPHHRYYRTDSQLLQLLLVLREDHVAEGEAVCLCTLLGCEYPVVGIGDGHFRFIFHQI